MGIGNFSSNIIGLNAGATYYVRAYATNSAGTAYGNQFTFNTKIVDVEGNNYNTVKIGTQIWMAENLKTTKYRNGDSIVTTTPSTKDIYWESAPKYQWAFWGDESKVATYGRLYTWYAVTDSRNVCSTGWHIPTNEEWEELIIFLGGWMTASGKLKETGTTHWQSPNTGATNEKGFTALPGGYRDYSNDFEWFGLYGLWWSSTEGYDDDNGSAMGRMMDCNSSDVSTYDARKQSGFSVRCIKDN